MRIDACMAWAVAAALHTACVDVGELELPAVGEAESLLLVAAENDHVELAAIDLRANDPPTLVTLAPSSVLYALAYDHPLAELGLSAGTLRLTTQSVARSVPRPRRAWSAFGEERAWTELELAAIEELRSRWKLPGDANACERGGGCFRFHEGTETCEAPCLEPQPPIAPDSPELPDSPRFAPCPDGWRATPRGRGALEACAPSERLSCPDGWAQFVSSATCEPIGITCPPGQWAENLPPNVIYASAEGAGGDGSRANPIRGLANAIAIAQGRPIALAKGTYRELVHADAPLRLIGACVEQTEISAPDLESTTLFVRAPGVLVESLRITSGRSPLYLDAPGATLELRGVEVGGGEQSKMFERTTLIASRSVFRGGSAGVLVATGGGVHLELRDTVIGPTGDDAILIDGRATIELDGVLIHEIAGGHGLQVSGGALAMRRTKIDRTNGAGLLLRAATATISDVIITNATGATGHAIDVSAYTDMTRLFAGRVQVLDTSGSGIKIEGGMAFAELTDVYVEGAADRGLFLKDGATIALLRGVFERNAVRGIELAGSSGDFADLAVRGTTRTPGEEDGDGFSAVGSNARIKKALIEDNVASGVYGYDDRKQSTLELEDLTVRRTSTRDAIHGHGIYLGEGVTLIGSRIELDANQGRGLDLEDAGATSMVSDVRISHSGEEGLMIARSTIIGSRIATDHSGCAGVRVKSGNAELTELAIANVIEVVCDVDFDEMIAAGAAGSGIIAGTVVRGEKNPLDRLAVSRFTVDSCDRYGILDEREIELTVGEGSVSRSTIGFGGRGREFDLSDVPAAVVFRDNSVNAARAE